jgi:nicotinamide riboside kinase
MCRIARIGKGQALNNKIAIPPSLPRIVITGPESTGKSTLAKALADRLDGYLVEEYLRTYFETRGTLTLADAIPIAQGQWTREQDGAKAATAAGQPLICDTDLVSSLVYTAQYYRDQVGTALWQRWQAWARAQLAILQRPPCSPRLYLLCGTDWPWIDDGQRDAPDARETFHQLFEAELSSLGFRHVSLEGTLDARLEAVCRILGDWQIS